MKYPAKLTMDPAFWVLAAVCIGAIGSLLFVILISITY